MDDCIPITIPKDESGYTLSFTLDDADAGAVAFFRQFGFVVFSDIFSAVECSASQNAMWETVEELYP
jgi:hypothetical protein